MNCNHHLFSFSNSASTIIGSRIIKSRIYISVVSLQSFNGVVICEFIDRFQRCHYLGDPLGEISIESLPAWDK